jgi:ATP-dependent Zn protease
LDARNLNLRRTAYHEAGHALATFLLLGDVDITQVSVVEDERSFGRLHTSWPPAELAQLDRGQTINAATNAIQVALGGLAAECLLGTPSTSGALGDLAGAYDVAGRMLRLGAWRGHSPASLLDHLGVSALLLLREHRTALGALAEALLTHHILTGDAVRQIITSGKAACWR